VSAAAATGTGAAATVMRSTGGVPTGKWNHALVLCTRVLVMMSPLRVRRMISALS
jgi:hypothetical protein